MPTPSWAAIVTAVATLLTGVSVVIGALTLFLPVLRQSRANAKTLAQVETKVDKVDTKTSEVHVLVNQQHTDQANYNRALIRALREKGIAVPIDQSAAPTEGD